MEFWHIDENVKIDSIQRLKNESDKVKFLSFHNPKILIKIFDRKSNFNWSKKVVKYSQTNLKSWQRRSQENWALVQNTCIAPNLFTVVAILKFKMVIQRALVTFGTNDLWIQRTKLIKIGKKNQFWCRKSQNIAPYAYAFSMAAIFKIKMAAQGLIEMIGTNNFWIKQTKIFKIGQKKSTI